MGDKYSVNFTAKEVKFYELNQFFNLLNKQLDDSLKNKIEVIINDGVGGQHFILKQYGFAPNGDKCSDCKMIDCEECTFWARKKKEKEIVNVEIKPSMMPLFDYSKQNI